MDDATGQPSDPHEPSRTPDGAGSSGPRISLLEGIAQEKGDPGLFPAEVLRLYREGKRRRARSLLLKHARSAERSPSRALLQREVAANLRLWLTPLKEAPGLMSWNGIGTRLLGKRDKAADGSYIATQWFTFVFVPVWPIASYVVVPGGKKGWHFLSRAPVATGIARTRWLTGGVAAALSAALWMVSSYTGSHTDLFVYNGFDRPVIAHVGDESRALAARSHTAFEDLPVEPIQVGASWEGEAEPFESVEADLTGHGRNTVVYNVGRRGLISVGYALYGEGNPRPDRWLYAGPVLFVTEDLDYRFEQLPDTITISGSSSERTYLYAIDDGGRPVDLVVGLLSQGRTQQALHLARAELAVNPDDGQLAYVAASGAIEDPAEQRAFVRGYLEGAPAAEELHRAYQELWPEEERQALRDEYRALLAREPDSPMYHYLAGRIQVGGAAAETRHYRSALALSPDYGPAHRGLGSHAVRSGRWGEALAHFDRYAALGTDEALETIDTRLRLARRVEPGADESIGRIDEIADLSGALALPIRAAHYAVEADAALITSEAARILGRARSMYPIGRPQAFENNVAADLAITAGVIDTARARLEAIFYPENRDAQVVLRFVASAGASEDEASWLHAIPLWQTRVEVEDLLLALEWLDDLERQAARGALAAADLAEAADLLADPEALLDPRRLDGSIDPEHLRARAFAAFAAVRRLQGDTEPAAIRARRAYLATARAFALPGELPYLEP